MDHRCILYHLYIIFHPMWYSFSPALKVVSETRALVSHTHSSSYTVIYSLPMSDALCRTSLLWKSIMRQIHVKITPMVFCKPVYWSIRVKGGGGCGFCRVFVSCRLRHDMKNEAYCNDDLLLQLPSLHGCYSRARPMVNCVLIRKGEETELSDSTAGNCLEEKNKNTRNTQ